MLLSNLSIKRPVFASVMMLSLVTLGFFSYRRLAVDMYPEVEVPVVSIVTQYEGASPESVEREVSKRIEEAVNPISGVKHVISVSRESVSTVVVEFHLEVRLNDAAQEVRAKVAAIRGDLPKEIDEPIIQKLDFQAMPIISLSMRSETLSPRTLSTLVEKKVKRRLESISGVGKVDMVGFSTREVEVRIDPARLDALGIGVDTVIAGLRSENVRTPLGRLKSGNREYPLRISGKPDAVAQFRGMVIGRSGNRPVTLDEVAEVVDGIEEQRSLAFVDGVPAVGLDILKQSGANTVAVVDTVKKALAQLQAELPPEVKIEMVRDGSIMIRDSVEDVQKTMIEGGILTLLIVFIFLNSWRSTIITGLTLPISVIASFIAMNFGGMTLNVMTLMALSLAIGLLIDDAIVVRENIVRHLERGKDHFSAARDGTSEIGLAVLATTFSIVAVFVPVAYMKGIVGRFFFQFGITVTFAVLVSLFVSFTLDPMLSSRWIDPDIGRSGRRNPLYRLLDGFNSAFEKVAERYRNLIGWGLGHRITVIVCAAIAFIAGIAVFSSLPSIFMQDYDRAEFQINFTTAPDASIAETAARLNEITAMVKTLPETHHTYGTIGAGDTGTVRDGMVYIKLTEKNERSRSQKEIQHEVRKRLADIPGIQPSIAEVGRLHGKKQLEVNIRGEEIPRLKAYAAKLKAAMRDIPGIVDLEMTLEHDIPELQIEVDRQRAASLGIMTDHIAGTVGALVGGQAVSTYEDEDGDALDVRVRLPEALRQNLTQVGQLNLTVPQPTGAAGVIPLGDLIRSRQSATPSEINRRDLTRQVTLSANLDGIDMGSALREIEKRGKALNLAPGYRLIFSGEAEDMVETFGYMAEALLLAVIFVYLILAAQFESFIEPLSIMLSLPLSIVGMALMLRLTGDAVSIMSLIGLIMLMGLVTKNAILLVDYTKILRADGMGRTEALITAGRTRFRPILMTTLAMIFGMTPLALGIGAGAEMRAPMARAVIGGLVTSTLLTLLVVPVVYTMLDDFSAWMRRGRKRNLATLVAIILLWMISAPLRSEAMEEKEGITLPRALALAAERNRDIQMALEYQNRVQGIYLEERAAALPQLTAQSSAGLSRDETQRAMAKTLPVDRENWGAAVGLRQVLFTWGQVGAAIRAAKIGIQGAKDQIRRYRQAVARDVTVAFENALLARELVDIARDTLAQRERHAEESKRKFEAGTATDYDVLAAEVAVQNARPDVISAENLVTISLDHLALLLGLEGRKLSIDGTLETEARPIPDYDRLVALALEKRPELAESAAWMGIQRELITVAKAGNKPRIDFQGSTGWGSLEMGNNREEGVIATGEIVMTFPFFDGFRTNGRVVQAASELRRLEITDAKLRDEIRVQVSEALSVLSESGEILTAGRDTVRQAKRLLEMAEKGFIFGVKTNLEVQDAELNLRQARGNLAKATRNHLAAAVTLDWVTGVIELPAVKDP